VWVCNAPSRAACSLRPAPPILGYVVVVVRRLLVAAFFGRLLGGAHGAKPMAVRGKRTLCALLCTSTGEVQRGDDEHETRTCGEPHDRYHRYHRYRGW
jgi:hypothetical protein